MLTRTQTRYFIILIGIYLVFAICGALFQIADTPRSLIKEIALNNSNVKLHIQSPEILTRDGQRRQGRIAFSLRPFTEPDDTFTVTSAATTVLPTPAANTVLPISTQSITRTPCSRYMTFCLNEMGKTSASALTPSPATDTTEQDEEEPSNTNSEVQEWSFLVQSTEGVLPITSDGISFTPIITLSLSSSITEASFLVEHAALADAPYEAEFDLEDRNNKHFYRTVAQVSLESRWQFFWRRFRDIAVSLGSILGLIGVVFAYLIQDQNDRKGREEANLRHIAERLPLAEPDEIPHLIQRWVVSVNVLSQASLEVRKQVKEIRETCQNLYRHNLTVLNLNNEVWIEELYEAIHRLEKDIDPEDIHIINDLRTVFSTLHAPPGIRLRETTYIFSDAYLFGIYLNFLWSGMSTDERQTALERLQLLVEDNPDNSNLIWQEALWGIYACDEQIDTMKARQSLRKELGDWYSNLDVPEDKRSGALIPSPGNQFFTTTIDLIAGGNGQGVDVDLIEWCQTMQNERNHKKSHWQTMQRIRESLWPIAAATGIPREDANYDFSSPSDEAEYWNEAIELLKEPYHHYIQGESNSGKSWLRIYFENTVWSDNATFLPTFYFPPRELLYRVKNRIFLYRSFAQSIANCLVAALLESSTIKEEEILNLGPFLARYGYSVPLGKASLAVPTSPVADLDRYYANKWQSFRLAQIREATHRAQKRELLTDEASPIQILSDVNIAIDQAGFSRVYLLIDNLPPRQEEKIWPRLQLTEIGEELNRFEIYLKIFGRSPVPVKEWSKIHEVINPVTQDPIAIYQ
ncbi:MAG: hypothetical protein KF753_22960 [Caldilineaceae bacterium]|nr:hypothetical protein [Caldilineaceae bacterium]